MRPNLSEIEKREKEKKEKRKLDALLKYNQIKICSRCGGYMYHAYGETFVCRDCGEEAFTDFGKVREFLKENGPSVAGDIADNTGVDVASINEFLREGRIEIPDGSDVYIRCADCGAEIRYGMYCPACAQKRERGNSVGFYNANAGEKPTRPGDNHGRMHTLENIEKKNGK